MPVPSCRGEPGLRGRGAQQPGAAHAARAGHRAAGDERHRPLSVHAPALGVAAHRGD